MARNYKKSTGHILRIFESECDELCYTTFMPREVAEAKEKIRQAMESGPSKTEIVKEQVMNSLRKAFFMPSEKSFKYCPYSVNGERNTYE